ncbi:MAG: DNA adenine methylase [Selenomonadales bacterium]|jgi:DNA adenine methylase|nr:DNA adenine methylase [Selenomonadales bacterium]
MDTLCLQEADTNRLNLPTPCRSPLIWFGGKGRVAKHILRHAPQHTCYVEPFGGAAHVIAQKTPVYAEVYNDIDGDLVNFLLVVRENPQELFRRCDTLPYSRELFQRFRSAPAPSDAIEKAVRFFYLNRSGIAKGNSSSAFSKSTGWRSSYAHNTARTYSAACETILEFARRMKNVMIENRDFRDILRIYDSDKTLFYVDPPYIGREKYYAGAFSEEDHRDLARILSGIQGKAMVSYYANPLLNELYPNWRRVTFTAARQVVNGSNNTATEVLLMNFEETLQLKLEDEDR